MRPWVVLGLIGALVVLGPAAPAGAAGPRQQPAAAPGRAAAQAAPAPVAETRALQQLLADSGFYAGSIDGRRNKETAAAVTRAKEVLGLSPDAPDRTLAARLRALLAVPGPPRQFCRVLEMEATAYTSQDPGSGLYTKRGHVLRRGLAAVDPGLIRLGTRLYVEGYGYAVADDVGRAIKGKRIDLAFMDRRAALAFGRKKVKVYILDLLRD